MAVQLPKTIRQWFTPEQACEYLSQAFDCDITKRDLQIFFTDGVLPLFFKTVIEEKIQYKTPLDMTVCDAWFDEFKYSKTSTEGKHDAVLVDFILPKGEYRVETHGMKMLSIIENQITGIAINVNYERKIAIITEYNPSNLIFIEEDICGGISYAKNPHPISYEFLVDITEKNKGRDHTAFIETSHGIVGYPRHELDRFIKAQMGETNKNTQTTTRPTPISSQHRENLLRRIKAEGLDALQLTAGKGGKSGSKAQIKALLVPNTMTNSQFDKTWESAMRDQVIQYKP